MTKWFSVTYLVVLPLVKLCILSQPTKFPLFVLEVWGGADASSSLPFANLYECILMQHLVKSSEKGGVCLSFGPFKILMLLLVWKQTPNEMSRQVDSIN